MHIFKQWGCSPRCSLCALTATIKALPLFCCQGSEGLRRSKASWGFEDQCFACRTKPVHLSPDNGRQGGIWAERDAGGCGASNVRREQCRIFFFCVSQKIHIISTSSRRLIRRRKAIRHRVDILWPRLRNGMVLIWCCPAQQRMQS